MRFVQFEAPDGLRLNGVLELVESDTTIIHVHGKGGNFYENKFLKIMLEEYPRAGFNFLSFNNRGHSSYVEAYNKGEIVYVGAAVESFAESLLDLSAAEQFARTFSSRIVFQGHSFGCEKIAFYSQKVNASLELILLSPCDGYRLQNIFIAPERVEEQLARLQRDYQLEGMEWLPSKEYGIRVPGKMYYVPIVARALADLMSGPAFELFALDKPWVGDPIFARSIVYLGGRDVLQVAGIASMSEALRNRFQNLELLIPPDGDHHLAPVQHEVVRGIVSWLRAGS